MTKRRFILPVLAAVGLIAAGCGSDGSLTGAQTDTSSITTATTDTTGTDTTFTDTTSTDTTGTDTTSTDTTSTDTTGTDTTSSGGGDRFSDPAGKYSIEVPSAWISAQDSPKAWFLNDEKDEFRENVNILTETIPSNMSLDSYVDLSISKAPGMIRQFKVQEREKFTLDSGTEAYRLVYTGSPTSVSADLNFTFLAVVAVKDGTAVTLTMTAPPTTFSDTIDANWDAVKSLEVN